MTAILLALEALPDENSGIVRPLVSEAQRSLDAPGAAGATNGFRAKLRFCESGMRARSAPARSAATVCAP